MCAFAVRASSGRFACRVGEANGGLAPLSIRQVSRRFVCNDLHDVLIGSQCRLDA